MTRSCYVGVALGLVALSCVVCAGLCSARPAICAAVGICGSARGAQGASRADAAGRRRGDLADDREHSGAGAAGGACVWARTSFPRRWRVMSGGSYERSGELVLDSRAGQRDHGDGAGATISRTSTGGSGSAFSSRCAIGLAASGVRVTLFGPFTHPLLGGAVTVLWIVGLTNAFNMLDNMDGLAASVGLIAAALFCGAQARGGQPVRAGGPAGGGGGTGGFPGAQPRAGAAVHGGCGQ